MKRIFTLFFISCLFIVPGKLFAQVDIGDSLALVDLYNSTNGPNWNNNTNWLTKMPVSTWDGVYLLDNRVDLLLLGLNNLDGEIPNTIGNLTALTYLNLQVNNLRGEIPVTIEKMQKLTGMDLEFNALTGNIPKEIGNLTSLKYLILRVNYLSGNIPNEIGNLQNLESIVLGVNELTGDIPVSISNLSKLSYFEIFANHITGNIPVEFGKLDSLAYFFAENNNLTGEIPAEFGDLTNLVLFRVSNNRLSGVIPESFKNLINLYCFDVSGNKYLTGEIPSFFGNFTGLNYLRFDDNNFTGSIPQTFSNLKSLYEFGVSRNKMYGEIPMLNFDTAFTNDLSLFDNLFTFDGMEEIAKKYSFAEYAPQGSTPLHKIGDKLSISAGGTLSNNTYTWYKDGSIIATTTGDSTYTVTATGKYWVHITNSIVTDVSKESRNLILTSDTLDITALPVHFISFIASLQNNNAMLQWKTAEEQNAKQFFVQRSGDGINFTTIASVKANNTGSNINVYYYTDLSVQNLNLSKIYYRIQEQDMDGALQTTQVESVDINKLIKAFALYPNPAKDFIMLSIPQVSSAAFVTVFDMNGKKVFEQKISSSSNQEININKLAAGLYKVVVVDGNAVVYKGEFLKE